MGVVIENVNLSKNPVQTGERFKISASLRETVDEPKMYRMSFRLGAPKGNAGKAGQEKS